MDDILTDFDGGVLIVTIDRPQRRNAITRAMYHAMSDALERADADAAVRVVVLRGSESAFTAGNDIGDFLDARDPAPAGRFILAAARCCKPMIAAVCGPAVGIGTTILMHFDLVYAADTATFATPFVDLGLCPEAGSSLLMPQAMGHHRAAEMLLLGEALPAPEALRFGLVNRVLPVAEAHAAAMAAAHRLAAKPLAVLVETKRLMKAGQAEVLERRVAEEGASFSRLLAEPPAREALTAFREKRKPDFSRF